MKRRNAETMVGKLDRMGVERVARAQGLPAVLASHVADIVTSTGLREDRREEVFRELVSHFLDGLDAGRSPQELLDAAGEPRRAARLIQDHKRLVTPESHGGSGVRDNFITRVWRDARYAVRRLVAKPGFTITAILSLALGIGANAAMFTLVNDIILRKPSLAAPERLIEIYMDQGPESRFGTLSYPDLQDVQLGTEDVFSGVAGMRLFMVPRSDGGRLEQATVEMVTPNYFDVLGLRAGLGRMIEPEDAPAQGTGSVVVLTHNYWRRAFASDPRVIGTTIHLSGAAYTIIGVAPADYPGSIRGISIDLFAPITMSRQLAPTEGNPWTDRSNYYMWGKARLRDGVTQEHARVALGRIATDLINQKAGAWTTNSAFTIMPFTDVIIFPPLDRFLVPIAWMLMVVVGLVLVIACANLAAFLLARAVDRRKEIAVRLALGATKAQLVTQFMVETVLLAVLGGAVGVVLARVVLRAVLAADLPLPVPLSLGLSLDWRVLGFSALVSVGAGMVFGLVPALQATRFELASVIRDESGGGGRTRGRLRQTLVAAQVAVSVVLLVAAGLFVRSLDAARSTDPGFGAGNIGLAWVATPMAIDSSPAIRLLRERLAALPGVETIGISDNIAMNLLSTSSATVSIDGVEPPAGQEGFDIDKTAVDTGFFNAAGYRLLRGRNVTLTDTDSAPMVAVVNQAFVDKFFPGRDGLGQAMRLRDGRAIEIVGVVNTAKVRTLGEDPRPAMFLSFLQWHSTNAWIFARTSGDADRLVEEMNRAIKEREPEVFYFQSRTMKRHFEIMSLPIKLGAFALGGFALLALVMASTGLYGTVSYSVAQRTREVGIRLSLGASRSEVVRLLLGGGLKLVAIGAGLGLASAFILARLLQSLLFGIRAIDPLTFVAVPAVLLSVAFLAAWLPARRAGRVDPQVALRSE
jgi:macrolide transport system ATP-binding/permease protein